MAAKTTQQAGDWATGATWTGGVKPVVGTDTVTINHAVTVSTSEGAGVSPGAADGTNAIRCNAAVTIQNGGTLDVRGDVGLNNVPFNIEGGGIFEFNASGAGTPATALYRMLGINSSDPNAILTITGSSGNHAVMRSNAGGANGRIENNGNDRSGLIDAEYCDFLRIGDASNEFVDPIQSAGDALSFVNCTFTSCGNVGDGSATGAHNGEAIINFDGCVWFTSVGDRSLDLSATEVSGAGIRRVVNCYMDKHVNFGKLDDWTVQDVILPSYEYLGGPTTTFERVLMAIPEDGFGDLAAPGLVKDCYLLRVGDPTNQHGFTLDGDNTVGWDGCIFDMPDGSGAGAGDCITMQSPSSPLSVYIKNCIVLETESGGNVGTLVSCLGGANLTISAIEWNTYEAGQGIYLGEGYSGHANMISTVRNNIAWSTTAVSAKVISADIGVADDIVASANVHHNGKRNPTNTDFDGYDDNLDWTSGSPGASDVTGDPNFVDPTRNIKTWDLSLGGAGTVASALAGFQNRTAGYTVTALLEYVRAGFAPQNASFHAASDSSWMGAVQPLDTDVTKTPTAGSAVITGQQPVIGMGIVTGTMTRS